MAWIGRVADEGRIAFTADRNTRRRNSERMAYANAGITVFFVTRDVLHGVDWRKQIAWLFDNYAEVFQAACSQPRGTHFSINRRGQIEVLAPLK